MARKKKAFDYNDTFPKRLRQLISENLNITQGKLAEIVGVTRQTVGIWCSGESSPDAVSLKKIADCFDVSIDWLLNENAPRNVNAELSAICKFTGLTESAVMALHSNLSLVPTEDVPGKYRLALNKDGMIALSDFLSSRFAYDVFMGITSSLDKVNEVKNRQEQAIVESSSKYTDEYVGKIVRLCRQDFAFAKLHRFESSESMNKFIDEWLSNCISKMGLESFPELGLILPEFAEKCIRGGTHDGEHIETDQ